MKEDELQSQIVRALRLAGLTVLVTSRRRKRCHYCGHYSPGGDGVTKGTPDLILARPCWGAWLKGVEVKTPDGSLRPEQKELVDLGVIEVARTLEEALAIAGIDNFEVR